MPSLLLLLGGGPRLFVKRDDAIPFGFGGDKVRQLALVAGRAVAGLGFALAMAEMVDQSGAPDVIVHASSSGGTQAGLVAGCRLLGLKTRVVGVSADDSCASLTSHVRAIISGIADLLNMDPEK